MCGIAGIVSHHHTDLIEQATDQLISRGPDARGIYRDEPLALGHRRLSIIDTTEGANQPMQDESGRYTLVFNGEFYQYKAYRNLLENEGVQFRTQSDTEVLLQMYVHYGEEFLQKLDGFFALAIYDKKEKSLLLARDRMGIKPLYWYADEERFCFASEMKALMALGIPRMLDRASLFTYLQLNYIPAPNTILRDTYKLLPGHFVKVENVDQWPVFVPEPKPYYEIPKTSFTYSDLTPRNYVTAQQTLFELLDESVKKRLVSDVPLGAFLSGGIDSSTVVALASRHVDHLNTFSIGFKDEPFFDETDYAEKVAQKFKTNHTVFSLSNDDLYGGLQNILDYIDEPFADSSAINVYLLSQYTRKEVTVALSGDGADEMFSGYNKHYAEFRARNPGLAGEVIRTLSPILRSLPQGRHSKWSNLNRQLNRFAEGMKLSNRERYWRWATFSNEEKSNYLLREPLIEQEQRLSDLAYDYKKRKDYWLRNLSKKGNLNEVLYTDMQLVLPNDMLYKVDLMSMANSLEVRTPFLDKNVVDFAFEIPVQFKINERIRKKIVQDTFRKLLPEELFNRPKKGFEVPLLGWLRNELDERIRTDWLNPDFLEEQQIFNPKAVESLLRKLHSPSPDNAPYTIWALIVFQAWYKKYLMHG